jgi:hypothetical protein
MANIEQIKKIFTSFDPTQVFSDDLRQKLKKITDKLIAKNNINTGKDLLNNIKNLLSKRKNDKNTKHTLKKLFDDLLIIFDEVVKKYDIQIKEESYDKNNNKPDNNDKNTIIQNPIIKNNDNTNNIKPYEKINTVGQKQVNSIINKNGNTLKGVTINLSDDDLATKNYDIVKSNIQFKERYMLKNTNAKVSEMTILDSSDDETLLFDDKNIHVDNYQKEPNNSRDTGIIISTNINENNCDDHQNILIKTEEEINNLIPNYNKYNKEHPMFGINYSSSRKKWKFHVTEPYIFKYSDNLDAIIEESKQIINSRQCHKKSELIGEIVTIEKITLKNKHVIFFQSLTKPLFDILHVLYLLDVKKSVFNEKYNSLKNKITHYGFTKNKFGGYVLREFITENTLNEIMMLGTSDFCIGFRKDYAKIMTQLRQLGGTQIVNDSIVLNKDFIEKKNGIAQFIKTKNNKNIHDSENTELITKHIFQNNTIQTYDNPYYFENIMRLINDKMHERLLYANTHMMYFLLITIKDPDKLNRIFVKIGYSAKFEQRFNDLKKEYGCNFFPLAMRTVENEQFEVEFHKKIREVFPHLHVKISINDKNKEEIYIFDMKLLEIFLSIKEYNNPYNKDIERLHAINKQVMYELYDNLVDFINNNKNITEVTKKLLINNFTYEKNDYNSCHNAVNLALETMKYNFQVMEHKDKVFIDEYKLKLDYNKQLNKDKFDHEKQLQRDKYELENESKKLENENLKLRLEIHKAGIKL